LETGGLGKGVCVIEVVRVLMNVERQWTVAVTCCAKVTEIMEKSKMIDTNIVFPAS